MFLDASKADQSTEPECRPMPINEPNEAGRKQPLATTLRGTLSLMFGADLRALAAFRIVLGVIVLADLLSRWSKLREFYSDAGLLSRETLFDDLNPWRWSIFLSNGTESLPGPCLWSQSRSPSR